MSATPYRPDIDGLRAVAVLAVVAYHGWPHALSGGFVGVDIFFVISGYLITRILVAPGLAFADFYRRRIRRIFPALLIVLASTLTLGATFLPPDNFSNLLGHAIGGGLFVANVVSYHDVGYFNGVAELKPLLHLWSLGVEEQFYLVWPVLVWIAARKGVLTGAITVGALLSFAAFAWLSEAEPRAAFYLSPPRFWELLAGALLVGVVVPARWTTAASSVGLGLIALSIGLITSETEFPGVLLADPRRVPRHRRAGRASGGTAAVEPRHGRRRPDQLSALSVAHWPLLSLLRNFERAPSAASIAAVLVLSLALAALHTGASSSERPLARWRLRRKSPAGRWLRRDGRHRRRDQRHLRDGAGRAERRRRRGVHEPLPVSTWRPLVLPPEQERRADRSRPRRQPCESPPRRRGRRASLGHGPDESGRACRRSDWSSPVAQGEKARASTTTSKSRASTCTTTWRAKPSLRWVIVSAMWRTFDDAGRGDRLLERRAGIDLRAARRLGPRQLRRRPRAADRAAGAGARHDRPRHAASRPRRRVAATASGAFRPGGGRDGEAPCQRRGIRSDARAVPRPVVQLGTFSATRTTCRSKAALRSRRSWPTPRGTP